MKRFCPSLRTSLTRGGWCLVELLKNWPWPLLSERCSVDPQTASSRKTSFFHLHWFRFAEWVSQLADTLHSVCCFSTILSINIRKTVLQNPKAERHFHDATCFSLFFRNRVVKNGETTWFLCRLRAGLMPASGPPAREGADIETLDGQVVGKARQLQTSQGCGVNGIDWNLALIATMGECKKTSLRKQCKKAVYDNILVRLMLYALTRWPVEACLPSWRKTSPSAEALNRLRTTFETNQMVFKSMNGMKSCMNHPMFQVSALKERYFSRWRMGSLSMNLSIKKLLTKQAKFDWPETCVPWISTMRSMWGLERKFYDESAPWKNTTISFWPARLPPTIIQIILPMRKPHQPSQATSTNPTTSRAQTCKWWCVASDIQPKSGSQNHTPEAMTTDLPQRIGFATCRWLFL